MADTSVGLSYDTATTSVDLGFGLAIQGTALRATIQGIGNPNIVLRPSGNVAEQIVSGVAWPLAQTMASVFSALCGRIFAGQSFEVFSVGDVQTQVQGHTVTVRPSNLHLSAYGDMTMVQGNVDVV